MKIFYQAEAFSIKLESFLTFFGLVMKLKELVDLKDNEDIAQYDVFLLSSDTSGINL